MHFHEHLLVDLSIDFNKRLVSAAVWPSDLQRSSNFCCRNFTFTYIQDMNYIMVFINCLKYRTFLSITGIEICLSNITVH